MKIIKTNSGAEIMVDDHKFDFLNQLTWYLSDTVNGYAKTWIKNKSVPMHRIIMGVTDPKVFIDHRDRNRLNNQIGNLRIATRSQNCANRHTDKRYLGVTLNRGIYCAKLTKDGKRYCKYGLKSEFEAALAYNELAIKHHGDFARLNVVPNKAA